MPKTYRSRRQTGGGIFTVSDETWTRLERLLHPDGTTRQSAPRGESLSQKLARLRGILDRQPNDKALKDKVTAIEAELAEGSDHSPTRRR